MTVAITHEFLNCELNFIVEQPFWIGHVPFGWWLTKTAQPTVLVELGTYTGVSYSALCNGIKSAHASRSKAYCVDTWQGDEHTGSFSEVVFERFQAFHRVHLDSNSTILRSTFDQAVEHFQDRSIDILHIDGFHSYEAVSKDLRTWLPKLSERAILLLHDVTARKEGFGVWQLWEELSSHYPSFVFPHSWGLGVLALGSEIPSPIRWLFECDPEAQHLVQRTFAKLGGICNAMHALTMSEILQAIQEKGYQLKTSVSASPAIWLHKQTDWT